MLKIVLVGDQGTQKTTFIMKYLFNSVTFNVPRTNKPTNYIYNNLEIWDIGGKENVGGIMEDYFKNLDYMVLFGNNLKWIDRVKRHTPNVQIINYTDFDNLKNILDNLL